MRRRVSKFSFNLFRENLVQATKVKENKNFRPFSRKLKERKKGEKIGIKSYFCYQYYVLIIQINSN